MADTLAYSTKKDVASCDKPRQAATSVEPGISEWRNPHGVMTMQPLFEYIE